MSDRDKCLRESWRAMEELYESGKCRAIGVSNFLERHLDRLASDGFRVMPHVNQCEFHPYQNPVDLRKYCKEKGIHFQVRSFNTKVRDNKLHTIIYRVTVRSPRARYSTTRPW